MLKLIRKSDRTLPIICCDVCGTWIDDAALGAAVFASLSSEGDTNEARLTHKGACHDKAEAELRGKGHNVGWLELKDFLSNMLHNSGVSLDVLKQMHADHEKFGRL
ncbi:hypothetical protein GTP44_13025 [Duganella sp. FT50W]|uniref:Uncharacterized protein n=1 Tax=Duganella lactea TaxID=2692173 RepID=A0A6L8MID6_9BURK|nr:hypothetical protein [Duganella lactea]MYM82877.1 hypothetical protein [Duganella lactea]